MAASLIWDSSQAAEDVYLARISADGKEMAKVKVAVIRNR